MKGWAGFSVNVNDVCAWDFFLKKDSVLLPINVFLIFDICLEAVWVGELTAQKLAVKSRKTFVTPSLRVLQVVLLIYHVARRKFLCRSGNFQVTERNFKKAFLKSKKKVKKKKLLCHQKLNLWEKICYKPLQIFGNTFFLRSQVIYASEKFDPWGKKARCPNWQ